jgi:hypothetical protein
MYIVSRSSTCGALAVKSTSTRVLKSTLLDARELVVTNGSRRHSPISESLYCWSPRPEKQSRTPRSLVRELDHDQTVLSYIVQPLATREAEEPKRRARDTAELRLYEDHPYSVAVR